MEAGGVKTLPSDGAELRRRKVIFGRGMLTTETRRCNRRAGWAKATIASSWGLILIGTNAFIALLVWTKSNPVFRTTLLIRQVTKINYMSLHTLHQINVAKKIYSPRKTIDFIILTFLFFSFAFFAIFICSFGRNMKIYQRKIGSRNMKIYRTMRFQLVLLRLCAVVKFKI